MPVRTRSQSRLEESSEPDDYDVDANDEEEETEEQLEEEDELEDFAATAAAGLVLPETLRLEDFTQLRQRVDELEVSLATLHDELKTLQKACAAKKPPAKPAQKPSKAARTETAAPSSPAGPGAAAEGFFLRLVERLEKPVTVPEQEKGLRSALVDLLPALAKLPSMLNLSNPRFYKEPLAWYLIFESGTRNDFYAIGTALPGPRSQQFKLLLDQWGTEVVTKDLTSAANQRIALLQCWQEMSVHYFDTAATRTPADLLYDARFLITRANTAAFELEALSLEATVGGEPAKRFRTNMRLLAPLSSSLSMSQGMSRVYGKRD